jgi:DNA-directed RNA polymerase specialized sigma24 family protein
VPWPGPVLALEPVAQAVTVSQDTDVAAKELLGGLRAALDPDPERAGRKYVLLRRKLVSFFEWSGATSPDARADETLMGAAWKLTDGEPLQSLSTCCAGIARTVLHKQAPVHDKQPDTPEVTPQPPEPDPFEDLEGLLHSFETAFGELPEDSRDLIVTYYAGEQRNAIEARQALAQRLSVPPNQLRLRAHRARTQLEQSVLALTALSPGETK